MHFTHPILAAPTLSDSPVGTPGMRIPCPPVSQAEVVLEGRASWNAHLRACVWIVQDATEWPAATIPIWDTSVFKKHSSSELVEDDGVHDG